MANKGLAHYLSIGYFLRRTGLTIPDLAGSAVFAVGVANLGKLLDSLYKLMQWPWVNDALSITQNYFIYLALIVFIVDLYFFKYKQPESESLKSGRAIMLRFFVAGPMASMLHDFTINSIVANHFPEVLQERLAAASFLSLSFFTVLSIVLTIYTPLLLKALVNWKRNDRFVRESGLLYHFPDMQTMKDDKKFQDYLDSLGEIKTLRTIGVTGTQTFVSKGNVLETITKKLKMADLVTWEIFLCHPESDGLSHRAEVLKSVELKQLKNDLSATKDFIDKHPLNKKIDFNYYHSAPKLKIIIINDTCAMVQGYLNNSDIHEEQVYIFEDRKNASMYKIIKTIYDDFSLSAKKEAAEYSSRNKQSTTKKSLQDHVSIQEAYNRKHSAHK